MGLFGVTYTVGPTKAVPTAEVTPQPDDPALPRMPSHVHPVRPRWSDFEIDGLPLHDACEEFLDKAGDLNQGGARDCGSSAWHSGPQPTAR